jgi:hypothetical protein
MLLRRLAREQLNQPNQATSTSRLPRVSLLGPEIRRVSGGLRPELVSLPIAAERHLRSLTVLSSPSCGQKNSDADSLSAANGLLRPVIGAYPTLRG